jgi:ribosomal small subunit protein bTHX
MNKSNPIIMGKGDRKSKRGKIFLGTYGARRRRKKIKNTDSVQLQSVREKDTRGRRTVRGKKTESEAVKTVEETAGLKDREVSEEKATADLTAGKEEKSSGEATVPEGKTLEEKPEKETKKAAAEKKASKSEESGKAS